MGIVKKIDKILTYRIRDALRDINSHSEFGIADFDVSDGTPDGDKMAASDIAYQSGWEHPETAFTKNRFMQRLASVAAEDGYLEMVKKTYKDGQRDSKNQG